MSKSNHELRLAVFEEHFENAPKPLKDYVYNIFFIQRRSDDTNQYYPGSNVIASCNFSWDHSLEGNYFWENVHAKKFEIALQVLEFKKLINFNPYV